MRQDSRRNDSSREEKLLKSIKAATKASDAAGDGVFDLEFEDQTGAMDSITCIFQDSLPAIQTLPSPEFDSTPSGELPFHPGQHGMFPKSPASGSTDWLCWDPPEEDFETDEGKRSSFKRLSPLQESISSSLADAAHQVLKSKPQAVLKGVLEKMLHNPKPAWNLAPYMLAIMVDHDSALYKLAAADIEAAATLKGVQTWPQYAINAAGGMKPICLLEMGYCRYARCYGPSSQRVWSVQAAENLTPEKRREATTGMCDSQKSSQFGGRLSVNKKVFANIDKEGRKGVCSKPTAELARKYCMDILANSIILTHNPSGFDERALLRIQLIDLAELYQGLDCMADTPEEAVWKAAKELLDDAESEIPMFFKGFGPVRQVLDVLHTMLRDIDEYMLEELMKEAEQAGVRRLKATLGQAFKVHADCCSNFSENLLTCVCQVSAYLLRNAAVCKHARRWAELAHLA